MITWPPQPHRTEGEPQEPEVASLTNLYRIVKGLSDNSLGSLGRSFLALFYFTAGGPKNDLGEFLRKCTFLAPIPEILIWQDCGWEPAICILPQYLPEDCDALRCSEAIRGPKTSTVFPSLPFPLKSTKCRHTKEMILYSCIHSQKKSSYQINRILIFLCYQIKQCRWKQFISDKELLRLTIKCPVPNLLQ